MYYGFVNFYSEVVSWDYHMGLIREVRPYKTRNNAAQKVRKMPHEKASTGAAMIPGHLWTLPGLQGPFF